MKIWAASLIILFLPGIANADAIFSIDFDPIAEGIQGTYTASPGEVFTADLVLNVTDLTVLSGYSISLSFDTPELSVTIDDPRTPPSGWFELTPPVTSTPGVIGVINASNFSGTIDNSFNAAIASFTITANSPASDGSDLILAFSNAADGINDANGDPINGSAIFNAGTVNAVPEPGSLICLGAVFGLTSLYRRRMS